MQPNNALERSGGASGPPRPRHVYGARRLNSVVRRQFQPPSAGDQLGPVQVRRGRPFTVRSLRAEFAKTTGADWLTGGERATPCGPKIIAASSRGLSKRRVSLERCLVNVGGAS